MTTLTEIYEQTADRMRDVEVSVDSAFSWVTIHDITGANEDIFLEGEEAEKFIQECDDLWNSLGDVYVHTLHLALASPYCENIWN